MSEADLSDTAEVITLPSSAVKYGDFVVEPWPSLRIQPYRSLTFADEIVRAVPGSRFWPPIPGGVGICPLTNFSAIDRESEQQSNCSISYAGEIIAGHVYLYAPLEPVRATVALRKDISNGAWKIQEVRAANNADVSADTMAFVRLWFSYALSSSPTDN